jgi:hypothetical protein
MLIDGKKTYQIGIPIHWGYPRHCKKTKARRRGHSSMAFRRLS